MLRDGVMGVADIIAWLQRALVEKNDEMGVVSGR